MSRRQVGIAVFGILIIGAAVYAAASLVYASSITANADSALNTVVSHQGAIDASFTEIDTEVRALGSSGTFDAQQAVTLVDRSVASLQAATTTIEQDESSLAAVQGRLSASRWLTALAGGGIDRETVRIGHARIAFAAARTIAADEILDGSFWHALCTALADLDVLNNQAGSGDLASAKSTLTKMTADLAPTVQQSTSPGLPADLHSLMTDLETFAGDFGKQLDAQIAGDNASVAQYQTTIDADRTKLGAYDVNRIGSEIDAFYQPLIARFNSEMAAATS